MVQPERVVTGSLSAEDRDFMERALSLTYEQRLKLQIEYMRIETIERRKGNHSSADFYAHLIELLDRL